MIKYVWETNIFNFSRKDVLICHLVLTKRMVLINLGFILTKKILLKSFVKFILCLTFVNCYDNFIFLYIIENVFFHLCEKWRGNNFVIKPFSSILLVSEFLFTTKNISCFIEHHFTPEDTVVIIMAGGFWFWPQSQLSFSNHFWSFFQSSLHCSMISNVVLKPFLIIFFNILFFSVV